MEGSRTQRITAKDISGGRIRVPRETKRLFPSERAQVRVDLLGHFLECRWDPKHGPDKERSGVVGVPRQLLASLVAPDEVLHVFVAADGVEIKRAEAGSQPMPSRSRPVRATHDAAVDQLITRDTGAAADWRRIREEAAAKYQPRDIRLLLVAEAPPSSLDRYFYFPDVSTQDSLFRYVVRLVLGIEPDRRSKLHELERLQAAGVFLTDLCVDPLSEQSSLRACVPDLVSRAAHLDPDHIIVIKTRVYDEVAHGLRQAGLPIVNARIAFPGSGQQRRFEFEMQAALDSIGWIAPEVSH